MKHQKPILGNMPDFDAVIVAAGDAPTHPLTQQLLERHQATIICCDSATDTLLQAGFQPMIAIGDGDSISKEAKAALKERFIQQDEQETNDLTKAFHYAVTHHYRRLLILGATGKREDHTLGNISLLADYMDQAEVVMMTNDGCFTPATGHTLLRTSPGEQLSFFCMDSSPITVRGVRWPLESRVITRWWQATLNEATGSQVTIESHGKVLVFRPFEDHPTRKAST